MFWKTSITLAFVLVVAPIGGTQIHAPSVEQCRADRAVWADSEAIIAYNRAETAHATEGTPNRTEIAKLPLTELEARMKEMANCLRVDGNGFDKYYEAHMFYHSAQADRWLGFIVRHDLQEQMRKEDAAGLR
jgi:hypothetical protein